NLSKAATDAVRRNGLTGLGPALTTQLRLAEPTPETRLAMTSELRESHCGQMPDAALDRMVDVQWARDARMAASLARGGQRRGAHRGRGPRPARPRGARAPGAPGAGGLDRERGIRRGRGGRDEARRLRQALRERRAPVRLRVVHAEGRRRRPVREAQEGDGD